MSPLPGLGFSLALLPTAHAVGHKMTPLRGYNDVVANSSNTKTGNPGTNQSAQTHLPRCQEHLRCIIELYPEPSNGNPG